MSWKESHSAKIISYNFFKVKSDNPEGFQQYFPKEAGIAFFFDKAIIQTNNR